MRGFRRGPWREGGGKQEGDGDGDGAGLLNFSNCGGCGKRGESCSTGVRGAAGGRAAPNAMEGIALIPSYP